MLAARVAGLALVALAGCYSARADVVSCDITYPVGDRTVFAVDASGIDGETEVCASTDCKPVAFFDLTTGLTVCDVVDQGDDRPVFDMLVVR